MSAPIRFKPMGDTMTLTELAYYTARDLLRTCGNDWLDYGLTLHPEERYNLARDGEKMALELSEAFGRLATLAEREERTLEEVARDATQPRFSGPFEADE